MKILILLVTYTTLVAGAVVRDESNQQIFAEGPACPLDDPLVRVEQTPVNATLHPLTQLLEGSFIENLHLAGLSTLHYNYTINFFLLTASFQMSLGHLRGNASYQAQGYVDARPLPQETAPSGNFTGNGAAKVEIDNLHFNGRAAVMVNIIGNKVQLTNLTLTEVRFDRMAIEFENYVIGGETINWTEFNQNVKANFDRDWPIHGTALSEKFKQAANIYLGRYTLAELIDLIEGAGDGDCEL